MTMPITPIVDSKTQAVLDSLRLAVANTLEHKRRLGHYVVFWDGKKPVFVGEDAPIEFKSDSDI
ncbi:MAG: hypothetical protein ABSB19_04695 [Methylomonas sp.]|jgi:hypothetical protein